MTAAFLFVHPLIGDRYQVIALTAVMRVPRGAEARANHRGAAAPHSCIPDDTTKAANPRFNRVAGNPGQNEDEFVSTQPGYIVDFASMSAESLRHFLQYAIAGEVPHRVVDGFETIEIAHQHRNFGVRLGGIFKLLA